ncbi:divalent-cation tolerance protein CutA [Hydrogenophaga sp. 5NK40-0174]|uniref:divalent-cation tolerance protein CutA n=1 Tax=Hydrogenophaga sp. 5NK40-0174 TaxID=3127649 RepID=UPI003109772F
MQLLAVYTTVSDESQAESLAGEAIEQGLAACIQIEPIRSVYRWKGQVEREHEVRIMFKTTAGRYQALARWLARAHPYEMPAIYAVTAREATEDYANWVRENVSP